MNVTTTHRHHNLCTLLAATAAALLLSMTLPGCTTDESAPDAEAARQPIAFGTDGIGPTRTAPGTITLDGTNAGEVSLRSEGFGVFACHTGLHPYVSSSVTPNLMWNQQVTYDNANAVWDYTPLVYWPNTSEGLYPYVSFYAYAPYAAAPGTGTTAAERCIVDMSLPVEQGDPWLVYQLGGSDDDWQAHQVDLLYDFQRDQQQGDVAHRVDFRLRHALACAGDKIQVVCSTELLQQLMNAYSGTPVSITLNRITLAYTLLRKGRLWLNSTDKPRWESVASESPTVERLLTLQPPSGHVLATATSATACDTDNYSATNQGIFYIPLSVEGCTQQVTITVDYTTSTGLNGSLTTTVDLTAVAEASTNRSFRIVLPAIDGL